MDKIKILSTTNDALTKNTIGRISKSVDITFDFENIGKGVEEHSYVEERKQCNFDSIINFLGEIKQSIVIIEKDLYFEGLNWCFGGYAPDHDCIILSLSRLQSENHLYDLMGHEIGHMLGTCPIDRENTIEMLGSHCTNDLCVMQQKMTVAESIIYTNLRHDNDAHLYCEQCMDDISNN